MEPQLKTSGSVRLGSYLRKLRVGYGYSLRRVEERARDIGGEIDNSQLSRYEKGICYPSFDKLRTLASVFNVSIQSFSDVVELEAYERLKPRSGTASELLAEGTSAMKAGDPGLAFACFERALELLLVAPANDPGSAVLGEVRVSRAVALQRLGKLALAEQELRAALKNPGQLDPKLLPRAVLALANVHAFQGERFLSEVEATRAIELARAGGDDRLVAMALHTIAHVLAEQRRFAEAVDRCREAADLYAKCGEEFEALGLRINIGGYYVEMGKLREGIRMLQALLIEARRAGLRRLEAQAWSNLGSAYYQSGDTERARRCLRESDALAVDGDVEHSDILFHNAFYEWQMAQKDDNPTRVKLAFGRLKILRSRLERRIPEVEAFDECVERGQSHA